MLQINPKRPIVIHTRALLYWIEFSGIDGNPGHFTGKNIYEKLACNAKNRNSRKAEK
jgi:hypothetical protein